MKIDTSEFKEITEMMTDARLQPLRERVEALEAENAELQEVIQLEQQTVAMLQDRLAMRDLQIQKLQSDLQQVQHDASENMMLQLLYQHYILLCVPAIQDFMLRTEQRDRSQLIHFLIHSLPEDARQWESYQARAEERSFFNDCLAVARALDAELQGQE